MEGITELGTIGTEKGDHPGSARSTGWAKESLFGFIDSGGAGSALEHDLKFDLLVCDDMGTEIADFIGLEYDESASGGDTCQGLRPRQAHLGKLSAGGKRGSSQEPRFRAAVSIREAAQTETAGADHGKRPRRTGGQHVFARGVERRPQLWKQMREAMADPRTDERGVDHAGSRSPAVPTSLGEPKTLAAGGGGPNALLAQAAWGAVTSTGARMRVLTTL